MNQYQRNGECFGWGPGVATLNPEKTEILRRFAKGKVLDIACGSGIYTNFLYQQGLSAIGVDNQSEFVKKAKIAYPKVEYKLADALKLPFANDSFDTAILFDILEHLDDQRLVKEASRVAKRLIISVPHVNQPDLPLYGLSHAHYLDQTHQRVYTQESLKKLLKNAGLNIIEVKPSLPISLSGLLVKRLSQGNQLRKILLKIILKPFLPEPPLYSTLFAIAQRS